MTCPLCEAKRLTERYYEDNNVWVADCSSHPDKKLIVWKEHKGILKPDELAYIYAVARIHFPDKKWRGPRSILDHFHLHEV